MSGEVYLMLAVAFSFICGCGCWFAAVGLYSMAVYSLDDLREHGFCLPMGVIVAGAILSCIFSVLSGFALWKFVVMALLG